MLTILLSCNCVVPFSCLISQNELSQLWLNTCYIAYHRTGFMYEKYNAFEVGVGGGGGEYTPQKGFGWSNAVALLLLQQTFPPPGPDSSGDGGGSSGLDGAAIIAISCAAVFVGLLLGGWLFMHVFHPVPSSTARTTMVNGVNLQPISPQVVGANIVQGKHPAADIAV